MENSSAVRYKAKSPREKAGILPTILHAAGWLFVCGLPLCYLAHAHEMLSEVRAVAAGAACLVSALLFFGFSRALILLKKIEANTRSEEDNLLQEVRLLKEISKHTDGATEPAPKAGFHPDPAPQT
jgi:hypothetical protein